MVKKVVNKLIIIAAFIAAAVFIYTDGHRTENFHGDTLGYYLYLPSVLIYDNAVDFTNIPEDMLPAGAIRSHIDNIRKYGQRTENGTVINQYTYGVALMELPFFLVAHVYEKAIGSKANGFSESYQYAVKASSIVYALLGLLLVFMVLRQYFSETIATVATAAIFLGSNLYWFTTYQAGMSHVPLFFLYALLIYLTIRVHRQPQTRWFIAIGLVAGIITLMRPTDCMCLLIPLLYNVYNRQTIREKILFIRSHIPAILLMAAVFVIPAIPQFIYWKAVSGHYLYYSYGEQTFYWTKPRIWDGLTGASNGWLTYSPLMIFAILGFFCYRRIISWNWCLWIIFPLYCYIIYSWYCFNYINGLGSRPMIHLYPLLALPMAAFFEYISEKPFFIKASLLSIGLFFIAVNISYSYQQVWGILRSEESNYVFNTGIMFRSKLRYEDLVVKDIGRRQPDTTQLEKVATLAVETFEDTVSGHYYKDIFGKSKYVYLFYTEEHFDKSLNITYHNEQFKDANWFKCSGYFLYPDWPDYYKHLMVLSVKRGDATRLWKACTVENKIGFADGSCKHDITLDHVELNKWGQVYFYMKIPKDMEEGDQITLDLWNIAKKPLYMDDFTLEIYK